jgi:hypothetical protein
MLGRAWPAAFFAALATVLVLVVWQSSTHFSPAEAALQPPPDIDHGQEVLAPWLYWDSTFYREIADHGYPASDQQEFDEAGQPLVAFFPGYPAAVRLVSSVTGDVGLAAILTTLGAGLGLAVVARRWFSGAVGERAGRWATLALFLFPWSFIIVAAGYSEALFLLAAVSAFVLLEDDRPVAAGLVGAVASATRAVGVGVVVGLVVVLLERRGALRWRGWRPQVDWSRLRRRDAGVLLSAGGIGGWMLLCWVRYGDPMAFSTAQRGWSQGVGVRSVLKLGFFQQLQDNQDRDFVLRLGLQGVVMIAFCLAIPAVWRRLGSGYGLYTAVVLGVPLLGSTNFTSNARFALAAFPVFALAGEQLARLKRSHATAALGTSSALLLGVTALWGRGYWMC